MKNGSIKLASMLALVGAWAVLVADSTDEKCGTLAGYNVTYDFDTDCMGGRTTGRMLLEAEPSELGVSDNVYKKF